MRGHEMHDSAIPTPCVVVVVLLMWTTRGAAAAASRIVRGDESRRRRGRDADGPRGDSRRRRYYAWLARSLVSATLFTILGNVCKVVSIGINVSLWDKHASPFGIACLLFSLGAAYFYKQAPLREKQSELPTVNK